MESLTCVYCGSKISKHALLCPNCRAIGFIARGNNNLKRYIGALIILASSAAVFFIQLEQGTFADKAVNFTEGFVMGLGIVIAFVIPKRKS